MGDCHLGGWRFPELQELNMQSFSKAFDLCIKQEVDMVLISGDLFDSAFPGIDVLKKTFAEFKKLHDAKIPCFIIAGSHDYSVSGKTFLDVLEHAGFCKNASLPEEKNDKIVLQPITYKEYAIYGYPGKKSGIEVQDLKKIEVQDAPGFFKILMLHTAIKEAVGTLPIDSISLRELPKADYYALSHLHVDFAKDNAVYSGPIFPNNFEELHELAHGQFYIVEFQDMLRKTKIPLRLKETLPVKIEITNALTATDEIIKKLNDYPMENRIILLKVHGSISIGKESDIDFDKVERFAKEKKAYILIRNTSKLTSEQSKIDIEVKDIGKIEQEIIASYLDYSPLKIKNKVPSIINSLGIEKNEGETNQNFSDRIINDAQKIINFHT